MSYFSRWRTVVHSGHLPKSSLHSFPQNRLRCFCRKSGARFCENSGVNFWGGGRCVPPQWRDASCAGSRRPMRRRRRRSRSRREFGRDRSPGGASHGRPARRHPWRQGETAGRSSVDELPARRLWESDWNPPTRQWRRRRRWSLYAGPRPGSALSPRPGPTAARCDTSRTEVVEGATSTPWNSLDGLRRWTGPRRRPRRRRSASTDNSDRGVSGAARDASETLNWNDEFDVHPGCPSCTSPPPRSRLLPAQTERDSSLTHTGWFTSSCAYHLISVTTYHSVGISLQT